MSDSYFEFEHPDLPPIANRHLSDEGAQKKINHYLHYQTKTIDVSCENFYRQPWLRSGALYEDGDNQTLAWFLPNAAFS